MASTKNLKSGFCLFLLLTVVLVSTSAGTAQSREDFLGDGKYGGKYWPTDAWRECRPEEVGMDSNKLMRVYDYVAEPGKATKGIVIIRKGYIVGESYLNNTNQHSYFESYSMAKSVMSAIIGIAFDQNILESIHREIYHYFPELVQKRAIGIRGNIQKEELSTNDAATLDVLPATQKRLITIRDVLQMRSGLEWNEPLDEGLFASDVAQMILTDNYLQYVLTRPLTHEPGTHWRYSSGDSMLLSGLIERASGRTAHAFGYDNLFLPIGMPDIRWESDPAGHTIGGWGIEATARDYAKFGYLFQKKGRWEDRQVVSEAWVKESTQPISEDTDYYGYQWWLLPALGGHEASDVPEDTFYALGLFNQNIFVIPSEEIVIVRTAQEVLSTDWNALEFLNLVMDSIVN